MLLWMLLSISWTPREVEVILEKLGDLRKRGCIGMIGYILGLYRDNGKEHGNYHIGMHT